MGFAGRAWRVGNERVSEKGSVFRDVRAIRIKRGDGIIGSGHLPGHAKRIEDINGAEC